MNDAFYEAHVRQVCDEAELAIWFASQWRRHAGWLDPRVKAEAAVGACRLFSANTEVSRLWMQWNDELRQRALFLSRPIQGVGK